MNTKLRLIVPRPPEAERLAFEESVEKWPQYVRPNFMIGFDRRLQQLLLRRKALCGHRFVKRQGVDQQVTFLKILLGLPGQSRI